MLQGQSNYPTMIIIEQFSDTVSNRDNNNMITQMYMYFGDSTHLLGRRIQSH